eukprot:scaffold11835_cov34-Prasinocladus_malaysianus.AAC.3
MTKPRRRFVLMINVRIINSVEGLGAIHEVSRSTSCSAACRRSAVMRGQWRRAWWGQMILAAPSRISHFQSPHWVAVELLWCESGGSVDADAYSETYRGSPILRNRIIKDS